MGNTPRKDGLGNSMFVGYRFPSSPPPAQCRPPFSDVNAKQNDKNGTFLAFYVEYCATEKLKEKG